jgi:hypothetical protein
MFPLQFEGAPAVTQGVNEAYDPAKERQLIAADSIPIAIVIVASGSSLSYLARVDIIVFVFLLLEAGVSQLDRANIHEDSFDIYHNELASL